jgi:hypothetical protein
MQFIGVWKNEDVEENIQSAAYRKIISCTNVKKIKSLGKCLFKSKCKWENKV